MSISTVGLFAAQVHVEWLKLALAVALIGVDGNWHWLGSNYSWAVVMGQKIHIWRLDEICV